MLSSQDAKGGFRISDGDGKKYTRAKREIFFHSPSYINFIYLKTIFKKKNIIDCILYI